MKRSTLPMKARLTAVCLGATLLGSVAQAQVVALDQASLYPGNPDGNWPAFNGGFGYDAWTRLTDFSGGGTYMEGVGVNGRQVDDTYSFGVFAGSYDISRQLSNAIPVGQFSILTRFDTDGSGLNLVNLRSGNSLTAFGGGELLSFGIANGTTLDYTDSSGFHLLPSGEARGAVWDWTVNFNATTGAYSLSVTNLGGGYAGFTAGTLELTGTTVGSFAVVNSSSSGNHNVIFDQQEFTAVPEPATVALFGLGAGGLLFLRRRR